MKLTKIVFALLATAVLSSCSDSDNGTPSNYGAEIAGTYTGYALANAAYFQNQLSQPEQVTITASASAIDEVAVVYRSSSFGTITIAKAKITPANGVYTLAGEGTAQMGMGGNSGSYACTLSGTMTKDVVKELTFTCPTVMGGLTMVFKEGEAPASVVIPGSYQGWASAKCAYFQGQNTDNQTLTVTAGDNDTYNIAYTSDTWGEFTVIGAKVTIADGVYTITGEGKTLMGMEGAEKKEYQVTLKATVSADKDTYEFAFTAPAVMGGLTVTLHSGDMPAAETTAQL